MFRTSRPLAALAIAASVAFALPATAGAAPADNGPEGIVGGVEATTTYPWMAYLGITTSSGSFMCGGTQISRDTILTAQHCMKGVKSVNVRIGSNNRYSGGVTRNATAVRTGAGIPQGDWAVLKIPAYDNSQYAKLPTSTALNNGPTFKAMGWGATSQGGDSTDYLREVDLPFVPDSAPGCNGGSSEICAGDLQNGGIDTCQGDSGGPLVIKDSYGRWTQVGITSWGHGCAQPGEPGHYTEVTTYLSSIKQAISAMGATQPTR